MKSIIVNRKTIALVLLTVFLICGTQEAGYGFFGGIIGAIGDVAGAVGGAIGAVGEGLGIVVDVVADTVKIAAEAVGLTIRIVATVLWHTDSLWDIELFPNGGIIGVVISNLIHLWDPLTGQTTATLRHDAAISSIAFSPDGMLLASGSEDSTVQLWNPETQVIEAVLRGHTDGVLDVAFSPDSLLLASGSADGTIRLWNPETRTLEAVLRGHTNSVLSVAFSPDGMLLASGSADGTARLWNTDTETLQATLRGHTDSVLGIVFNLDGSLLASGSADGTVRLWNPQTAQHQTTLDHESSVLSIIFSPDGSLLASGSTDGTARLWDPQTGKVIATLGHESPVRSVAFNSDGNTLVTGSADGKTRQWEITTKAESDTPDKVRTPTEDASMSVTPGDEDTSLVVRFSDSKIDFFSSAAYVFQWRRKEPQGEWQEKCMEIEKGEVTIDNLAPNTTYQVRYSFAGFICFVNPFSGKNINVGQWSPIGEGTTGGTSNTNNNTSTSQPTLTPTTSDGTIVQVQPASVVSPAIGEELTLTLNIIEGKAIAGYQAAVQFDTTALRYVSGANGNYLPAGAFFVEPVVQGNLVNLNAASLAGESNGNGTLAALTFEVVAVKASALSLPKVLLVNSAGEASIPQVEEGKITESTGLKGDVNGDGIVNIQDLVLVASNLDQTGQHRADVNGDRIVNIQDLVLVAGAINKGAAAPSWHPKSMETFTAADVQLWLSQAQHLTLTNATSQRGILFLEQILTTLIPEETVLLPNYPNPFNPETWIPYHLASDADIVLHIYTVNGTLVRKLALGHQSAGRYQSRSHAAYWDGRNAFGEPVASGIYFYTLTAGDFAATRKMLIRK